VIKTLLFPTIFSVRVPIKINTNGSGCDLPGDPTILPLFTVVGLVELTEFDEIGSA